MAFDQHEARRIARAAEEYMREHQLPGYLPTPEENQAFHELRTRRSVANFQEDLEAMREANTALVVRTFESYARHNAELDEQGGAYVEQGTRGIEAIQGEGGRSLFTRRRRRGLLRSSGF